MSLALYCFDYISSGMLNSIKFFPYYIIDFLIMLIPSMKFLHSIIFLILSKNTYSYSASTVIILLISQGLNILFYFFYHYSIIILGQSLFQFAVALLMAFLKFYLEEPVANFPFISQNITLPLTNRIWRLDFSSLSRFFYLTRAKSFIEFLFSLLIYSFFTIIFFIILYFFVSRSMTIHIIEITSSFIGSFILCPTYLRIYKNNNIENNNVLNFLILQFIFCDALELILLLHYKMRLSFITGITIQLIFDTIFFLIFSIHKYSPREAVVDEVNLIQSTSESSSNPSSNSSIVYSTRSILQSDSNSDESNSAQNKSILKSNSCTLHPLPKINECNLTHFNSVNFNDFRWESDKIQYEKLNSNLF